MLWRGAYRWRLRGVGVETTLLGSEREDRD